MLFVTFNRIFRVFKISDKEGIYTWWVAHIRAIHWEILIIIIDLDI